MVDFLPVKYEDLIANPERVLIDVLDHGQIDYTDEVVKV